MKTVMVIVMGIVGTQHSNWRKTWRIYAYTGCSCCLFRGVTTFMNRHHKVYEQASEGLLTGIIRLMNRHHNVNEKAS